MSRHTPARACATTSLRRLTRIVAGRELQSTVTDLQAMVADLLAALGASAEEHEADHAAIEALRQAVQTNAAGIAANAQAVAANTAGISANADAGSWSEDMIDITEEHAQAIQQLQQTVETHAEDDR